VGKRAPSVGNETPASDENALFISHRVLHGEDTPSVDWDVLCVVGQLCRQVDNDVLSVSKNAPSMVRYAPHDL
jgi:hypothetical protein